MFLLEGKPLALDVPFEHEGIRYPANWLRLASVEEKEALGVIEVEDQIRPDDRFYWVSQNEDGSFTAVPKDLDDLKAQFVAQVKETAGTLLAQSDWKVVRASEGVKPVDDETLAYRASVRSKSNDYEASINACTSVEELAGLSFDWKIEPQVEEPVVPASVADGV